MARCCYGWLDPLLGAVRVREKVPVGRYHLSHPQLGDNNVETGFLRLDHVRIPRTWLLMK
jgi:hypothetical protein